MATHGYVKASFTEQLEIYELLKQHLMKLEGSEFWTFADGWDDERIAKQVNPKFTATHSASVRLAKFGKLRGWSRDAWSSNATPDAAAFAALQLRVQRLEQFIQRLRDDLGYDSKKAAE